MPQPLSTPGKDPVAGGWVSPRAGLDGGKSCPTGIRSSDRPARSSVAIPTKLPGPLLAYITSYLILLARIYVEVNL
jgi:hypothetical protein